MRYVQIDHRLSLFETQGDQDDDRSIPYFYACASSMFEDHLVAFVDEMVELDHAESTVKIYLSCITDAAKAMRAAEAAACDSTPDPPLLPVRLMVMAFAPGTRGRTRWSSHLCPTRR
ncbi:hypothetical protein [Sphingomonas oleivorans]|uniref:hypothetical protein n=1 Tax=Sphingomonas oleivorans TaxID=1735121 RepID=UPI0013FDBB73|nr:hypothetical protein [Sphingomonas oleivorans]